MIDWDKEDGQGYFIFNNGGEYGSVSLIIIE